MHIIRTALAAIATAASIIMGVTPATAQKRVLVFDIKEEIASTAWVHTSEALRMAREKEADQVIVNMNTYGGEVTFADSIRSFFIN